MEPLSRRNFGRIAAVLSAGAALPFYDEQALAQLSMVKNMPADAVKINANENPMGPCAEAIEAITKLTRQGGRYRFEETTALTEALATGEGLKENELQLFAGSSAPLHQAVLAFCSKERAFIKADPGYEAGERAAQFIGARLVNVPLHKGTWDHDVRAMISAAPDAGLFYICNPNNPTGTLTSHAEIEYLVAHKPAGSIVMVDEAYIHFSPKAQTTTDLVKAGKDVVVLRTFSKLYGMAGLRAGAAFARPDLLEKLSGFSGGPLPMTAMAGARASLTVKDLVPERRRVLAGIRNDTFDWLRARGAEFIPSESNCFMLNTKRPGREFFRAMAAHNVYVGRVWPVWPQWVRVTVGSGDDMAKFKAALASVWSA
jgi:histidinol-phosphate aminotransferase